MILVQCHTGNITLKTVLEYSDWLTVSSVPDHDCVGTGDVEFESDIGEKGTENLIIVRGGWNERLFVFVYFEYTRTNNQSSMLRNYSHTGNLVNTTDIKAL